MKRILRIRFDNETECELIQKILSKKSYFWSGIALGLLKPPTSEYCYISLYDNKQLRFSRFSVEGDITFDEFLTRLENDYESL